MRVEFGLISLGKVDLKLGCSMKKLDRHTGLDKEVSCFFDSRVSVFSFWLFLLGDLKYTFCITYMSIQIVLFVGCQ